MSHKGSVVTIGVFDGVHVGHEKVVSKVVEIARRERLKSIAVTFDPHPLKVLSKLHFVPSLISLQHRIRLLAELGVDEVVVIAFTKAFSKLPAEKFVRQIIVNRLNARHVVVGEDFYFGIGASSGIEVFRRIAKKYGFTLTVVRQVKSGGSAVSSSRIRKLILSGNLRAAEKLLGRPVTVLGTVVKGRGIATELGFPTANINPHHEVVPPCGVYAVKASLGGRRYKGVLNIGLRPTFYSSRDEEPTIEAHLFGFRGNLYNRNIEVEFVKKLRDERKFRTEAALIKQIRSDAARAKMLFTF